jgi:nitrile hydratase subunit beta
MSAHFSPGDTVRVRNDWPEADGKRVHIRTPHFLRGQEGVVERILGDFRNPEDLAFGKPGTPPRTLYQVKFAQRALFPDGKGAPTDTLTADIYEHWLEAKRS